MPSKTGKFYIAFSSCSVNNASFHIIPFTAFISICCEAITFKNEGSECIGNIATFLSEGINYNIMSILGDQTELCKKMNLKCSILNNTNGST